jgi:hypothetical protein
METSNMAAGIGGRFGLFAFSMMKFSKLNKTDATVGINNAADTVSSLGLALSAIVAPATNFQHRFSAARRFRNNVRMDRLT